jgi:RimJ/RimL family protein N-acetyltransferase
VRPADLPVLFEFQREPEANKMAAFPSKNFETFMEHWQKKVIDDPKAKKKIIVHNNEVVGDIVSWEADDKRLVGYWIGKKYWGRGFASAALTQFLAEDCKGLFPIYAYVALHNVASRRILEKCGFKRIGEVLIAPDGSDETLMCLKDSVET